jgi:hypothetical protein
LNRGERGEIKNATNKHRFFTDSFFISEDQFLSVAFLLALRRGMLRLYVRDLGCLGSFAGKRNALELLDQIGFPRSAREQAAKLGALVDVHSNDLEA